MESNQLIDLYAILSKEKVVHLRIYRNPTKQAVVFSLWGQKITGFSLGQGMTETSVINDFHRVSDMPFARKSKNTLDELKSKTAEIQKQWFKEACEFYGIQPHQPMWVERVSQEMINDFV